MGFSCLRLAYRSVFCQLEASDINVMGWLTDILISYQWLSDGNFDANLATKCYGMTLVISLQIFAV